MRAGDVITSVRELLKDNFEGSYRWSDAELLVKLREACVEMSRRRPDSLFTTTAPSTLVIAPLTTMAQTLQINDFYHEALAFYVCALALDRDSDDNANQTLAEFYRKQFYRMVG